MLEHFPIKHLWPQIWTFSKDLLELVSMSYQWYTGYTSRSTTLTSIFVNWIKKVRIQESPWGADLRIPEEVAVKRCFWEGWGLELCQLCITYDQLHCWNREATRWWRRRWKRKRQAERLTAGYQVNGLLIQPCALHGPYSVSHPEGDMWTIRTWFPMKLNDYPIVVYWCFSLISGIMFQFGTT